MIRFRADPGADQFYALKTFRADGSAAITPIWLAPVGSGWFGYTPARSWKVRRIEHNPQIELAPCQFDGTPLSEWRRGRAGILPAQLRGEATRALRRKYGRKFDVFALTLALGRPRRHGGPAVGLAIRLDGETPEPNPAGRRPSAPEPAPADTPPRPDGPSQGGPGQGGPSPLDVAVFLDEVLLLAAYAVGGARSVDGPVAGVLLAFALPIGAGLVWGRWLPPRARHRLGRTGALAVKLTLFTAAAGLLAATGLSPWAIAFWAGSLPLVIASERRR
ncbi:DUF2568 domain-containing protein [Pseudactinotalea sp. HY160]|uniref:DUF2568 domain-containing protein n=1 Tax=Pseudactinotalea sp. HY160 TaxID=2654490 RepID=UPI00128BC5C6|nr:DUF2568 domain-containing protein [Pseudactinotalea sp. HY160]MPV51233.1 DUF2568 domain-containing protein [Pseudactinotalea sp. HY160]